MCRERCRDLSQIIAEQTAADKESDHQLFSEAVDSVLVRHVTENDNNFVDAQFLQAAWPQELDNVRLLIIFRDHLGTISTHNWNLFTPRADAQASIEGGQEWTGRNVILNLKDGHFTILRHQDPDNHRPIQDLLDKMLDADVTSDVLNHPGERKFLHLESVSTQGGEPDRTRCISVAQLHAQQLALPELSFASESVKEVVQDWSSVATINSVYGSIEHIDAAGIDWDEEYKELCLLDSAPVNLMHCQQPQQQLSLDQRRAQVQGEVFAAVCNGKNTLVVQQAGFGKSFMCMRLLSQTNFVLFLVPTNALLKQMVADITQLGQPCKSWGPDQSKGDAWNIVACSVAVVAVFDHMHELASVAKVAKDCKKNVIVVADEAHQFIKDRYWRRILNRSWELSSELREAKVKAVWILLSATLRAEDECDLAEALQVDIDVVVRDELKQPQDVNVQVITTSTLEEAVVRAKAVKAQIIFVKKYAEANKVAELLGGAAVWASKLPDDQNNQAIAQFEAGNVLVATYGLATGLNLLVQGRFPRRIAALGLPWSAESTVQLIGRERDGGDVYIIHWDLESTAHKGTFVCCVLYVVASRDHTLTGTDAQRELATHLCKPGNQGIQSIFGLFDRVRSAQSAAPYIGHQTQAFGHHLRNARLLQQYVRHAEADACVICGGAHATASCARLHGICYACGDRSFFGHSAANCPNRNRIKLFAIPNFFCCRCMLPLFEFAGIRLHSCEKSEIGFECKNSALADQVRMLLLAGEICGTRFGPGTYGERVEWATKGSPPNILSILARVAQQQDSSATPVLASPSLLSPEQRERIRVNREAALRRRTASPEPGSTPPTIRMNQQRASYSPSHLVVTTPPPTPPTQERARVLCSAQAIAAAGSVNAALTRIRLPSVSLPADRCVKCASAIHTGACTSTSVNKLLYDAKCCASCALPL